MLLGFFSFLIVKCSSNRTSIVEHTPQVSSPSTTPPSENKQEKELIDFAKKYIGTNYKYGGTTPKGFDCSGFTLFVYNEFGIKLPHQSSAQATLGKKIPYEDAQKGDLLFFTDKGRINHVGIVVSHKTDELKMIHSSSKRGIVIDEIYHSTYWRPRLHMARRVL